MIITISLISVFMLISIYLFFRAEGLQKELKSVRREIKHLQINNKGLVDAMVLTASKTEEFVRFRLNEIKEQIQDETLKTTLKEEIDFLTLLTSNYGAIYRECIKGSIQLKTITKTCLDNYAPGTYNNFTHFIANQETGIKRIWASNNLLAFVSLVEALLLQLNKKVLGFKEPKQP